MLKTSRTLLAIAALSTGVLGLASPVSASEEGQKVLLRSASINDAATTVTLPLFHGRAHGHPVAYIITESSRRADAARRGVNYSPKLANAAGTAAVQQVQYDSQGRLVFPASVDFAPERHVAPGPDGFPPSVAEPGAIGESGYTPLIQLPNGTILNAPHLANHTGRADKIISMSHRKVEIELTAGFYEDEEVRYISTEATDPVGAALENVTYAPALGAAPRASDVADEEDAASEELVAFTNGQVGASNPQRQGLSSALLDGLSPLNILDEIPESGRRPAYSPLWDIHLTSWIDPMVQAGRNTRQTDLDTVRGLAELGQVTGFGGAAFGPSGFFVNCPVISEER